MEKINNTQNTAKKVNGMPYNRQKEIYTTQVRELRGIDQKKQKEIFSYISYEVNKQCKSVTLDLFQSNYIFLTSNGKEGYDITISFEDLGLNETAEIEWSVTGYREIFKDVESIADVIKFTIDWINDTNA